jgi:hypothetical protein
VSWRRVIDAEDPSMSFLAHEKSLWQITAEVESPDENEIIMRVKNLADGRVKELVAAKVEDPG